MEIAVILLSWWFDNGIGFMVLNLLGGSTLQSGMG